MQLVLWNPHPLTDNTTLDMGNVDYINDSETSGSDTTRGEYFSVESTSTKECHSKKSSEQETQFMIPSSSILSSTTHAIQHPSNRSPEPLVVHELAAAYEAPGFPVVQDLVHARKLFTWAAKQGYAPSQYRLDWLMSWENWIVK